AAEAEGDLGDPNSATTGASSPGTCAIQSRDRQQAARVRSGGASRPRCSPGQSCRHSRDCYAEETQRPVQFEISEQTREAVASWVKEAHRKPEQFLLPSRVSESPHLSVEGAERRSKIDAANPRQWILSIRP